MGAHRRPSDCERNNHDERQARAFEKRACGIARILPEYAHRAFSESVLVVNVVKDFHDERASGNRFSINGQSGLVNRIKWRINGSR